MEIAQTTHATPSRLVGIDLARALAMLGMLAVNFKLVSGATPDGTAWLAGALSLIEGKAAALFVVLAGVGTSLMAQRHGAERILRRRALVLFVSGLAFSHVWPADILHFYGVYIAVAAALLRKSSGALLATAVGCTLLFVPMLMVFDYEAHWTWETLEYNRFWTFDGLIRHIFFNGFHPVVPWVSFFLIGMVLGRTDLRSPRWRRSLLVVAVAVFIGTEVVSRLLGSADDGFSWLGTAMMPPLPLYLLAATSSAVVVLMLALIVADRFPNASVVRAIATSGRFSLTIYLAHVVVGMGVLETFGLHEQSSLASLAFAVTFWISMIVFTLMWSRRHRLGPAEHILRALCGERTK